MWKASKLLRGMIRHRKMVQRGLGVVLGLAVVAAVFAQTKDARADVLKLQLQRFEGAYQIVGPGGATGSMDMHGLDSGSDWTISLTGKRAVQVHATVTYDPGTNRQKATLEMNGTTHQGLASIDGKDLTLELKDGKVTRRLRLHLTGRTASSVSLSEQEDGKAETSIFDVNAKRTV